MNEKKTRKMTKQTIRKGFKKYMKSLATYGMQKTRLSNICDCGHSMNVHSSVYNCKRCECCWFIPKNYIPPESLFPSDGRCGNPYGYGH